MEEFELRNRLRKIEELFFSTNNQGEKLAAHEAIERVKSKLKLSSLDGKNGFKVYGINADDYLRVSISSGDINGDGINDLIIGAWSASAHWHSYAGQSYVVFGASSFSSPFELSSLNGTNGFVINGISSDDRSGIAVSGAYDINGDNIDDLTIGAYYASPDSKRSNAGQSYVIFGKSSGKFVSPFELSSLNGVNGLIINGIAPNDYSGGSVSSVPDMNGDGINDVIIGAPGSIPNASSAGRSCVIFGSSSNFSSPFELSSLNGTNGFIINGMAANDKFGWSVGGVKDINGDHINDLIIGAYGMTLHSQVYVGQSYVIFGTKSFVSPFEISTLNGVNGFFINGIAAGDHSGYSVSDIYDINGDNIRRYCYRCLWCFSKLNDVSSRAVLRNIWRQKLRYG